MTKVAKLDPYVQELAESYWTSIRAQLNDPNWIRFYGIRGTHVELTKWQKAKRYPKDKLYRLRVRLGEWILPYDPSEW